MGRFYEKRFALPNIETYMEQSPHAVSNLDEIDIGILERIEQDFDVSLETLAEELDITTSTVHYRINKMKEQGVIDAITADVDPLKLGLEMVAITDVFVSHETGYSENIGNKLQSLQNVQQVYYTMGDVDFVVISRVQTREGIDEIINRIINIDGVNETSSKFVMQEFDGTSSLVSNMTDEERQSVVDR